MDKTKSWGWILESITDFEENLRHSEIQESFKEMFGTDNSRWVTNDNIRIVSKMTVCKGVNDLKCVIFSIQI